MADVTYYVAMPFLQDDSGSPVAGAAEECQSSTMALRRAEIDVRQDPRERRERDDHAQDEQHAAAGLSRIGRRAARGLAHRGRRTIRGAGDPATSSFCRRRTS